MKWLIELRHKKGLTQNTVANQSQISRQYYNFIENGERRPSPDVAQRIALVLGFSEWYRLLEKEHQPIEKKIG